jgi:hypothetical protein
MVLALLGYCTKINFDQLAEMKLISPAGSMWLKQVLDPFHDTAITPTGYPDTTSLDTFCELRKRALDLSFTPSSGNHDVLIFSGPFPEPHVMQKVTGYASGRYTYSSLNPGRDLGFLTVVTAPSGTTLDWTSGSFVGSVHSMCPYDTGDAANKIMRIVGAGFEVNNQTAPMFAQGTVTVAELPGVCGLAELRISDTTAALGSITCSSVVLPTPPVTAADIEMVPNSVTWDAKRGLYTVMKMRQTHNPLDVVTNRAVVMPRIAVTNVTDSVTEGKINEISMGHNYPFTSSVALFTGLHEATMLKVVLRVYVERAPTLLSFSPGDFMALAKPSPLADDHALALYGQVIRGIPPGVPRDENPGGEYYAQQVLGGLSKVMLGAAPFLGLIPEVGGYLSTAANIGSLGTGFVSDVLKTHMSAKAKKAPPPPRKKAPQKKKPQPRGGKK